MLPSDLCGSVRRKRDHLCHRQCWGLRRRERGVFVEQAAVLEAVVELAEHPVEQIAPAGGVPVAVVVAAAPVVRPDAKREGRPSGRPATPKHGLTCGRFVRSEHH
ncbi:hypothetical protein ACFVVA_17770 [Kitasatospora sp. NPDC058048]|uniref:hypothetical protein n=1 Tax=Kitasatospora sp. NPDC058048 TaxID=3346313 RepID=UPI0036DCC33E